MNLMIGTHQQLLKADANHLTVDDVPSVAVAKHLALT